MHMYLSEHYLQDYAIRFGILCNNHMIFAAIVYLGGHLGFGWPSWISSMF